MRTAQHPFSRPLDVASVGEEGLSITVTAEQTECGALAASNGVVGIESLSADLWIRRQGRAGLHVTGELKARLCQTCVVTLEPFDSDMVEPIDVRFWPESEIAAEVARRAKVSALPSADVTEEDLPDPIVNGRIDLGAIVAEFLALGLDPYPKKPGAAFAEPAPVEADQAASPFAVLTRLKTQ